MIIVVYINNILIFDDNKKNMKEVQNLLAKCFKMTDLDKISHYLDMKINMCDDKTTICQTVYLTNVIKDFEFDNCKSCKISMSSDTVNHVKALKEKADKETIAYYQLGVDLLI